MINIAQLFVKITLKERAIRELQEAKLSLLSAHSAREYAESVISYRHAQIARLDRFINNESKDK